MSAKLLPLATLLICQAISCLGREHVKGMKAPEKPLVLATDLVLYGGRSIRLTLLVEPFTGDTTLEERLKYYEQQRKDPNSVAMKGNSALVLMASSDGQEGKGDILWFRQVKISWEVPPFPEFSGCIAVGPAKGEVAAFVCKSIPSCRAVLTVAKTELSKVIGSYPLTFLKEEDPEKWPRFEGPCVTKEIEASPPSFNEADIKWARCMFTEAPSSPDERGLLTGTLESRLIICTGGKLDIRPNTPPGDVGPMRLWEVEFKSGEWSSLDLKKEAPKNQEKNRPLQEMKGRTIH